MKLILSIFAFLIVSSSIAQEDYILQINDSTYTIEFDVSYNIKLENQDIRIKLSSKDTLSFETEKFKFRHLKDYKVSETSIDDTIRQYMLIDADGTGCIIQEYDDMNPTMLNEFMISEVTKESLSYGYELKREDYVTTLKSGEEVFVDKAVLSYKGYTDIYEIFSIGEKDEGLLVMTMVTELEDVNSKPKLLDLFWESFELK